MIKILVIEDIFDNAELVRKALAPRNYKVIHAQDAETGLKMAMEEAPDLILLDLGLPDYDGQTLAGWLRAEAKLNDTPIIAFTAWPQETARKMVDSYGCDGYISKPIISIKTFADQVASYLKIS